MPFLKEVSNRTSLTEQKAFVAVSIISQKVGTARKAQKNIYAMVDNIRVELGLWREILNAQKNKLTLRQFACTYATKIHHICEYYGLEGDLAKKMSGMYLNLTQSDLFWLSNLQMHNVDCAQELRDTLMLHYKSLFNKI